jgi:hypothetical protein
LQREEAAVAEEDTVEERVRLEDIKLLEDTDTGTHSFMNKDSNTQ